MGVEGVQGVQISLQLRIGESLTPLHRRDQFAGARGQALHLLKHQLEGLEEIGFHRRQILPAWLSWWSRIRTVFRTTRIGSVPIGSTAMSRGGLLCGE